MPDVVTFDPTTLRIIEIDASGDNELFLSEIYSEWKDWMLLNDNSKHPPAFRFVGGDPISESQDLGLTYFLTNGWRFRPAESNHKLTLIGNVFTDPAGSSAFVNTLGAFTVNTETRVSNLVDSSVARLDLTQLLQEVYIDPLNGTPGTAEGVGTPTNPVDNAIDARIIADRDKLVAYAFRGNITIDADHQSWGFRGTTSEDNDHITFTGTPNLAGAKFEGCILQGSLSGSIEASRCRLNVVSGLRGVFHNCGFASNFTVAPSSPTAFHSCYSLISGSGVPTCILATASEVSFRDYSGGLELQNSTTNCSTSVDLDPGHLVINANCTGGEILVRGVGRVTNNSSLDITDQGFVSADAISESYIEVAYDGATLDIGLWAERRGETVLVPTTATVQWYEPTGTLRFSETDNTPDPRGHFRITRSEVLTGDTAYYAVISVTDSHGVIESRRGVPTVGA